MCIRDRLIPELLGGPWILGERKFRNRLGFESVQGLSLIHIYTSFNKERLTLIALTLVALLLAGCGLFGPKSFDIVVRIEPPVEGVKIFVDGVHSATTEADGQVELNVKANAKLTAELEGYTFKQLSLIHILRDDLDDQ